MKPNEIVDALAESATAFWNLRNERERSILIFGSVALALFLLYALLFAPAIGGRASLTKDLPALRQQLAQEQAMAKEASELSGAAVSDPDPVSQESVSTSLGSHGLKPQSLSVSGDLVHMQINPAAYSSVMEWLDEAQKTMRLTVVEANFVALAQTDTVNASLTLKQQKSGE